MGYDDESLTTMNMATWIMYSPTFHHKCTKPKIKYKGTYCKDKIASPTTNKHTHTHAHTMEDLQLIILLTVIIHCSTNIHINRLQFTLTRTGRVVKQNTLGCRWVLNSTFNIEN